MRPCARGRELLSEPGGPETSERRCATVEKIMHPMDEEMRRCVDDCLACHRVCLTTLSQHCLDVGGKHIEPRHTRLMLACAEICRTSAFFMELGTEFLCAPALFARRCARSARRAARGSTICRNARKPAAAVP